MEYIEKFFNVITAIPTSTVIVAGVIALLVLAFSSAAKKICKIILILAALALALHYIAPVFSATLDNINTQLKPYLSTETTPNVATQEPPATTKESSQAQVNYALLEQTNFEQWSPSFTKTTGATLEHGTYQPIGEGKNIKIPIGDAITFSADIYTDIQGLCIDENALATFIVGLACANIENSATPMPTHHVIVVSSGNCITAPDKEITKAMSTPAELLKTVFGSNHETNTYGLNINAISKDGSPGQSVILVCLGDQLPDWNKQDSIGSYNLKLTGLGHELATATLAHELCHSAFPGTDELTISQCAIAIVSDFGRSIFDIAP